MRVLVLATFLFTIACPGSGDPTDDVGVVLDAGVSDPGPTAFDAGFAGTLGSLCSQTSDCLDHRQRCYVGNANGSLPRCTVDCNDLDDCVEFSTGARISLDDTDCARPANSSGSRRFCVQSPGRGGGSDLDAGASDTAAGSDVGMDAGLADLGPQPDLGPGQVPGTFCSRPDHCRGQRCLAGETGDPRCAASCEQAEDCADWAEIAQLSMDRVSCFDHEEGRYCGESRRVPSIGWSADLVTRLHGVSGRVRIDEGPSLSFRRFIYDGSAHGLDVVLALSLGDPEVAAAAGTLIIVKGRMTCRIQGCPEDHPCLPNGNCNGAQFSVPLPVGIQFQDFDHVTVFDRAAGADGTAFATGEFEPPQR